MISKLRNTYFDLKNWNVCDTYGYPDRAQVYIHL